MTKVFNKSSVTKKRKQLRKNMPPAEIIMWKHLKGKQLKGYKFRRQYSVRKFIIDFYCPKLKLAIEIDGDTHYESYSDKYDRERQKIIESYGIRFLRFTNIDVYKNTKGVMEEIIQQLP